MLITNAGTSSAIGSNMYQNNSRDESARGYRQRTTCSHIIGEAAYSPSLIFKEMSKFVGINYLLRWTLNSRGCMHSKYLLSCRKTLWNTVQILLWSLLCQQEARKASLREKDELRYVPLNILHLDRTRLLTWLLLPYSDRAANYSRGACKTTVFASIHSMDSRTRR